MQARHYLTLDAMRGIAAIVVVIYHLRRELTQINFHGALAVDFFFMLSGFVIAHAYDERLRAGMSKASFFARRMIRLYPMYLVGAVIAAVGAVIGYPEIHGGSLERGELTAAVVLSIFFLPNPFSPLIYMNGPAWSLWYELLANLAYGFFHWLTRLWLLAAAAAACLAFLSWSAITKDEIDLGFRLREWPWGLARVGFGFTVGTIIYRCRAYLERVPRIPPRLLLAILAALLFVPQVEGYTGLYSLFFITVCAPVLVIAGTQSEPSAGEERSFVWLGRLSYPLYAIHRPLEWIVFAVIPTPTAAGSAALAALFLLGVIGLSSLLERWYERPARRWLAGLGRKRLSGPELAAAP